MDNLNLSSDESIIKKIQQIIISGARYTAVFTSSRLILVEAETGRIHRDIRYSEVVQAVQGMNALREPVISLTFTPAGKETETAELIFFYLQKDQNSRECHSCMEIFKDHRVPVQSTGPMVNRERNEMAGSGLYGEETSSGRPAVPNFSLLDSRRALRNPSPEEEQKRPAPRTIGIVIIAIMIIIGGIFLVGPAMTVKKPPVPTITTPVDTTPASPTQTPAFLPQVTSETGSSAQPLTVPTDGVWVWISYPGNFTGYIGALGRQIEVNSSGNQFYKVPAHDAILESSIEKMDGSAGTLEVGIYNGGTLISESGTQKPWGVVDIHVMVGPALGNPVVTEAPVPETTFSPYAILPPISIPASGVWVRVFSPANYTGSIQANGLVTTINTTGDQLFQIPVTSGMVDSSIEKREGTTDILIIEVYKNGNLVSRAYTVTPRGVVAIHTGI